MTNLGPRKVCATKSFDRRHSNSGAIVEWMRKKLTNYVAARARLGDRRVMSDITIPVNTMAQCVKAWSVDRKFDHALFENQARHAERGLAASAPVRLPLHHY